jgi:pimeloyl-ACP methyl ester carboxylesterase
MTLFGQVSGRSRNTGQAASSDAPLIVAIHGGTYTSAYFDVPGYSLLDRASANGLPIIALDRPSYGTTPILPSAEMTLRGQADYLTLALKDAWRVHGAGRPGMVIVAHSIGAAISTMIASKPDGLPLIGLAISGVCMRTPPEHRPMWESLPDVPLVEMPPAVKDDVMFGPAGSFAADMPAASHVACTTAPKAELVDIVSTWQDNVRDVLAAITVPVHYRQGEFDKLWIVDEGEVAAFEAALCNSRRVDARLMRGTGHCMDFHRISAAFHLQQLGFALQCAAEL